MPLPRLIPAFLLICALLAGCTPSDPQAALEEAVQRLQDNLEAKRNDEVLERIYIGRRFRNDTERLEKLFEMYTKMTAKVSA